MFSFTPTLCEPTVILEFYEMSPIINCAFVQDGTLVPIIAYLLLYSLRAQLFFIPTASCCSHVSMTHWDRLSGLDDLTGLSQPKWFWFCDSVCWEVWAVLSLITSHFWIIKQEIPSATPTPAHSCHPRYRNSSGFLQLCFICDPH